MREERMTNEEIVLEFFEKMNDFAAWTETVKAYTTPDVVFATQGMPIYQSDDHGAALLEQWYGIMAAKGVTGVRVEVRHSAAKGDVVFIERHDDFLADDGSVAVPADICSVIEMRDGKMAVIRDYMDLRDWIA
jgi:limonene-1,2-epoxide hydrolase